jgi:hypothetical protein
MASYDFLRYVIHRVQHIVPFLGSRSLYASLGTSSENEGGAMSRLALFIACVFAPLAAFAHHSRAPYDVTREILIEGTITKLDWRNPHILLTLSTRSANGEPSLQEIEVWAVSEARALGLSREAIAPGADVTVRAHPSRRGVGARALGLDVTTGDGSVYPLNTDGRLALVPTRREAAQGLAGQWVPALESYNELLSVMQSWPRTEAGRAAQAERARRLAVPGVPLLGICEPFPPPPLTYFPDLRTIEIGETSVVMRFEAQGMNLERIVHLNRTEHPRDLTPSTMGHSIGRFEGEALVVDTVGIAPHPLGWSPSARLIERLSLTQDRMNLDYTLTIDDPEYLVEPVSHNAVWHHRPDLAPSTERCDPEIARRILEE